MRAYVWELRPSKPGMLDLLVSGLKRLIWLLVVSLAAGALSTIILAMLYVPFAQQIIERVVAG